ncbi:MAG: hypothetical protein Q8P24_06435 [Desulfobacterales bacterium]|nr:hypothetical protein [Desulfobacterales bacterium]
MKKIFITGTAILLFTVLAMSFNIITSADLTAGVVGKLFIDDASAKANNPMTIVAGGGYQDQSGQEPVRTPAHRPYSSFGLIIVGFGMVCVAGVGGKKFFKEP